MKDVGMTTMLNEEDRYKEIRPYNDDEVPSAIQRLINDEELISALARFRYPHAVNYFGWAIKPLIRHVARKWVKNVRTVDDVQQHVARFMEQMIAKTSDGVTYSGLEHLQSDKGYLFISNHRDIAMDPAMLNWGLFQCGLDTVRIAIGDNLLRKPCATELMRLNKSFIVKRSAKGPREMARAFSELSSYIWDSLNDGHSIWIAQREGRAKDGDDRTDPAILKMFYMAGKQKKLAFADYMRELNIVPVAISYEYDPGDEAKARELYERSTQGSYQKSEFEDIDSIVSGIIGYKGRVHLTVGKPLTEIPDSPDELAALIDQSIHTQYRLFPSNLIAAEQPSEDVIPEQQKKFADRLELMDSRWRDIVRQTYAKPVENQQSWFKPKL